MYRGRYKDTMPFDAKVLSSRMKNKNINVNDLVNYSGVTFTKNQLQYFKANGQIPKQYYEEIEVALADPNFKGNHYSTGIKYTGELVDFGITEYDALAKRCKKLGMSVTDLLSIEHVGPDTLTRYKKERHIPSDLLEKLNRRLNMMEASMQEEPKEELKPDILNPSIVPTVEIDLKFRKYEPDIDRISRKIKMVIHCNGEANLNLNNIYERYDCNLETFVNSVFNLVSNDGYVIFTTYNNGKPVFSLGESI